MRDDPEHSRIAKGQPGVECDALIAKARSGDQPAQAHQIATFEVGRIIELSESEPGLSLVQPMYLIVVEVVVEPTNHHALRHGHV
jgi:hypothetical protein